MTPDGQTVTFNFSLASFDDGEEDNGSDVEVGDIKSAYTHAPVLEDETWVSLPFEAIPYEYKEQFRKVHRPVVRLLLALEGHPRAGKYWEEYCRHVLLTRGWEPVVGWECLYLHHDLKLL